MIDVRRLLAASFAAVAFATTAPPGLTVESHGRLRRGCDLRFPQVLESPVQPQAHASDRWSKSATMSFSVLADASQTTDAESEEAASNRQLPEQWLIPAIGLTAIIAIVMLVLLLKPDKNQKRDRDSESSEQ